jgi:hypothetical protein
MSVTQMAVLAVSALLVVTKALDCWSTDRFVRQASDETNPVARISMRRFGRRRTIWLVFGLVVGIVVLVGGTAFVTAGEAQTGTDSGMRALVPVWGYLVMGLCIAAIQAAVALTNSTGKWNPLSRIVLTSHSWLERRFRRR